MLNERSPPCQNLKGGFPYASLYRAFAFALTLPSMTLSADIVKEGVVGKVDYTETKWFSVDHYKRNIPLITGDVLDLDDLENNVAWLNRNPFQYTEILLSPGKSAGTSDVHFATKERFPWQFYAGVDNTGTRYTDPIRLMAGFNWGNFFGTADQFSFQFTASPDFHRFKSYLIDYTAYLPWQHELNIYSSYGSIHPKISDVHKEGKNVQASLRYLIPFKPFFTDLKHQLTWGLDYKWINSNLFYLSNRMLPLTTQPVTITQAMLGYRLDYEKNHTHLTFDLECYGSPVSFLPHQSDHDYQRLRSGSQAQYFYGKSALGVTYRFAEKMQLAFLVRGQASTKALLVSEQFGLGGYDTVRGYQERAFNADNAVCFNGEFRTPPISFMDNCKDHFSLLGFVDAAYGRNYDKESGVPSQQWLLGVGPGVRYDIGTYLTTRLDYGFQLHHIFGDHHAGRIHFSLIVSY
ncbi:MAG: BamA/TamA family outer membrane protein [Rhabdochlamydiaceae bacterium]|nr:BamA/TamA family outer membrane protein [Rhabdochlamydiaceae bacterium]